MSGSRALLTAKFNTPENPVQSQFRQRNHVAGNYRGPVYVVEDIYVACALCRAPVDPVTRIPVGRLYFHPHCLRCAVCEKPSGSRVFTEHSGQPVCHDCAQRGFKPHAQLESSKFSTADEWQKSALTSIVHGSRTPASAFTPRQIMWQMRQQEVLTGDKNKRVLAEEYGDDPSQNVAYINNPSRVAARIASREGRPVGTPATPTRRLLPALTPGTGKPPADLPKPPPVKLTRGSPIQ